MRPLPTAEYLWTRLDYNPETGDLIWKPLDNPIGRGQKIWNIRYPGTKAGWITGQGYREMGIDGRTYGVHRVIWAMVTGEWPPEEIDHINCDRSDNRFTNLRLASLAQNQCNSKRPRNNTTGFKGVNLQTQQGRYRAVLNGQYLGLFDSPEQAYAVRCEAARKLHGEFFNPG